MDLHIRFDNESPAPSQDSNQASMEEQGASQDVFYSPVDDIQSPPYYEAPESPTKLKVCYYYKHYKVCFPQLWLFFGILATFPIIVATFSNKK